MKKILLLSFVAVLCSLVGSARETIDKLEAFPGAEGYGRYTTGGRGGKVYHVTTLEDNNQPGSFRWACNQAGARTIVFDVSGNIHLNSELNLRNGNVTIAGQTAPGDGICVTDYPFSIKADNVIIRFMRFRLGNKNVTLNGADGWDGLGSLDQKNIIVDHCSVSWSIDECLSFSGTHNTTVQWCIVSQSLVNSGHSKGGHGYGGNWGGEYGSYHHNLLAHHTSRAPRLGPRPSTQLNEVMDMRNNVMFNYSGESCYGGEGMNVNIVNNYYKPGPGNKYSGKAKETRIASVGIRTVDYCLDKKTIASAYNRAMGTSITDKDLEGAFAKGKAYIYVSGKAYEISDDNKITVDGKSVAITWNAYHPALHLAGSYYVDGNNNYNVSSLNSNNWDLGVYNQLSRWENCPDNVSWENMKQNIKREAPITYIYTTTHSAIDAYNNVLAYAGASLRRDALDEMVINDAKNNVANSGTGSGLDRGFINIPEDVKYPAGVELDGVLPVLKSVAAPADTDGDGIPDAWETANGLDPNDASDGAKASASGYTNLELYMNSLVQEIMDLGNAKGKMLNGELTFADNAVELPVYDPSGNPDQPEKPGEVYEWEISNETYEGGNGDTGAWPFGNGVTMASSNAGRGYASGSKASAGYIKISRNEVMTITLPADKVVTDIAFDGWANVDNKVAWIASVNDENYGESDYVLVSRTEAQPTVHQFKLTKPCNPVSFKIGGNQAVLKLKLTVSDAGQSAIDDIIAPEKPGNGKIYNIMGVEVKEPLLPGIYIRDGKKFLVR